MSEHNLVIVESPAKAKTINKYLGPDFTVIASYGHVRDLPAKDGSVRPDEGFEMSWEVGDRSNKALKEIYKAAKAADHIYLATDPDREGEAISWHVQELLRSKKDAKDKPISRVTFNQITKSAILDAFENSRDLDEALINAYLARRALDYLVGFNISPLLWRKLPGARSAGRVQSVALRLVCERESEIEKFVPQEYWSIETSLKTQGGDDFTARLQQLDGEKLDKLAIGNKAAADAAVAKITAPLKVASIEKKQVRRNPAPPFITSTLQMEAARKLGFNATQTMRTAQRLYEGIDIGGETVGLITYMRTDGVTLSQEAINASRKLIGEKFGGEYVPEKARIYKSTAKNAQEAHEAIRPTDLFRTPNQMRKYLEDDQFRLYELIWKRTIAASMASAVLDQVRIDIADSDGDVVLRATGSVVAFDGFFKVYREGRDDDKDDESGRILPPLNEGDELKLLDVMPEQHFTQPPPRYSEASLVKKLEELGIGRPSTYASILQVLRDRKYVRVDKKRFIPEDRGRLVTSFMVSFFPNYVEYDFTADLEDQLDSISAGKVDWKAVLGDFWKEFSAAVDQTKDLKISDVIDALDKDLGPHFFPPREDGKDPRNCPSCSDGRLSLKLGRFGAFIGCSNYPECGFTRPLVVQQGDDDGSQELDGPRQLGEDPETGLPVWLKRGPYGHYVQLGPSPEAEKKAAEEEKAAKAEAEKTGKKPKRVKKEKPKRTAVPRGMDIHEVTLEVALGLLSLPRDVGPHPETGDMIQAGIGRFGPYLKYQGMYASLTKDDDVLNVGMNRAVELIAQKAARSGVIAKLGQHPKDDKEITVNKGRYGPYVKHGRAMASLPKGTDPEDITLEEALKLLEEKAAKKGKGKKKTAPKKADAKKTADKKPEKKTDKKTTAKKKSTSGRKKA